MRNLLYAAIVTVVLVVLLSYATVSTGAEIAVNNPGKQSGDLSLASRMVLGITLGQSTLREVQKKLGPAKLWSAGDAATAEQRVCYVTEDPRQIVLVFASNSEMSGPPQNRVTDVRIIEGSAYRDAANCLRLPISGDGIRTKSGLGLGLSREAVRKIIGTPTSSSESKWT